MSNLNIKIYSFLKRVLKNNFYSILIMSSITKDIKDVTWRDKEYFRLYQKELYKQKLGCKCMCENCGSVTTYKNLKKHQQTDKCKRYNEKNEETFKDKVERIQKILNNLSNGLSSNLASMD